MGDVSVGGHLLHALSHAHASSRSSRSPTMSPPSTSLASWRASSVSRTGSLAPSTSAYEPRISHPLPSGLAMAVAGYEADTEDLQYALEIAQAPSRGRTCGFGDADRRALSAPLIARLRIYSRALEHELPVDDIDISFLVVAADLWSADGTEEMNLVQHPSAQYSRSSAQPDLDRSKRPETADSHQTIHGGMPRASTSGPRAVTSEGASASRAGSSSFADHWQPRASTSSGHISTARHARPRTGSSSCQCATLPLATTAPHGDSPPGSGDFAFQAPRLSPPRMSPPSRLSQLCEDNSDSERHPTASTVISGKPSTAASGVSLFDPRPATMTRTRPSTGATSMSAAAHISGESLAVGRIDGEITCVKNLIGALTTNGHKLKAPGDPKSGVFFVFHDLSVRTEGTFRIRLRLVSLGSALSGLNTGVSSVLSECFSPPFEVMSAKKFPGMLDPTPMSQSFAKQGLRIPTRRGATRKRRRVDDLLGRETSPGADEEDDF